MEYRLRHNSGKYRWIQDDGTPRFDAKGEFQGYIGYCLDITERKRAENKTKLLSANLKAIFDSVPNVLAIVDEKVKVEMINKKGASLAGRKKQDLAGFLCGDVLNCLNAFQGVWQQSCVLSVPVEDPGSVNL